MKEILFAQRLADNEKKVRDRAIKKLRKYLRIKSSGGPAISIEDALKLWKGLFYCMYMADKPLVQESVAEDISGLIHYINNEEDRKNFIKAGFLTFAREWNGIDVFRIDKYMMFVRRFMRHIFTHLRACEWNLKNVMAYTSILETVVVCPDDNVNNTPLGLKTHVCEVILEELAKVGGENLQHSVVVAVIQPYFKVLALTKVKVYTRFVREGIIHHLIRQTLCAKEEEDGEDKTDNTNLETEKTTSKDTESEAQMDEEEEVALDPRAGRVDAYIPHLKVDLNLLADSLQKVGAVSRVQTKNREVIYKLVCELRDAAQGHDPLALPSDHVDDVEVPEEEVEKAVERLEKYEEDLRAGRKPENEDADDDLRPVKKRQFKSKYQKKKYLRLKKKKQQPKGLPKAKKKKLDKRQSELAQKRTLAVDNMVRRVSTAAGIPKTTVATFSLEGHGNRHHGFEVSPISQKKKPGIASKSYVNNFTVEVASDDNKKRKSVLATNKQNKKKRFDIAVLDSQSNSNGEMNSVKKSENVVTSVLSKEQRKKKKTKMSATVQKVDMPAQVSTCSDAVPSVTEKKVKNENLLDVEKKVEKGDKQNLHPNSDETVKDIITKVIDSVPPEKGIVINFSESKKQKGLGIGIPSKKSSWDDPLKEGEYEVFIKTRKQIKRTKEKKISPIKKRLTASIPRQRTISINLKKNKEHEFSDYVRTLRASPCIPFKADQAPKAPVLKPSPSPILVKGTALRKRLQKKVAASASPKLNFKKKRQTAADFF
ncbi:ribosomal RNA processing protein 1 homolog B-like [Portunus trituberculatus]|uniref:ribosomal RNA processing protein 1 homolog B-like n=1 Tax=Portunus trituberculatus TaxID=210409 RepID=UPI001E1CBB10|nr:ribosomal RNA processing protein 1 homolog B-like [Portunus trituberculatus]